MNVIPSIVKIESSESGAIEVLLNGSVRTTVHYVGIDRDGKRWRWISYLFSVRNRNGTVSQDESIPVEYQEVRDGSTD